MDLGQLATGDDLQALHGLILSMIKLVKKRLRKGIASGEEPVAWRHYRRHFTSSATSARRIRSKYTDLRQRKELSGEKQALEKARSIRSRIRYL